LSIHHHKLLKPIDFKNYILSKELFECKNAKDVCSLFHNHTTGLWQDSDSVHLDLDQLILSISCGLSTCLVIWFAACFTTWKKITVT